MKKSNKMKKANEDIYNLQLNLIGVDTLFCNQNYTKNQGRK